MPKLEPAPREPRNEREAAMALAASLNTRRYPRTLEEAFPTPECRTGLTGPYRRPLGVNGVLAALGFAAGALTLAFALLLAARWIGGAA